MAGLANPAARARLWLAPLAAVLLPVAASAQTAGAGDLGLVPWPAHVERASGGVPIRDGTPILVARRDRAAVRTAHYLADLLRRTRGLNLPVRFAASGVAIRIASDPSLATAEGYRLRVDRTGARIAAAKPAGLLYGAVSLWQLATRDGRPRGAASLPAVTIEDAPRFAWRGLMLDSARHFQSPAFVETLIDWMALHKLNTLHWHLVDDQGWRLEIKRYPRLTSVGAWRVEAGAGAAKDIDPATGRPRRYGGFYSQADVRRIVAYAAARNITIVPEIEMPGHASAAIAAYPELGSARGVSAPSSDWGVHANLFNTRDTTFTFLQNVLAEVMVLFPSRYIHIGGDEAIKDQWRASAEAQARIKALGLKDEDALQSWFIRRIERYLGAHGRALIGWDEILKGGIAPNATVMSWHGVAGAIEAAKSGHDAVLTPSRPLYFNYRQTARPDEPPGRAPLNTLADVFGFDPAPAELTPDERRHVLGVQANLWTEHVRTDERIEHMLQPRLAALAEIAWSPEHARGFDDFARRLVPQMARYRMLGVRAATTPFDPRIQADPDGSGKAASLTLDSQVTPGVIRFTLDGSPVGAASPVYRAPVRVALPATVTAAPFLGDTQIVPAKTRRIDAASLATRTSAELDLCKEAGAIAMEDDAPLAGPRAVFVVNYIDRCWIYPAARLDGVRSLEVTMGAIPFNLQVKDAGGIRRSTDGRDWLEVRQDRCTGPLLARLSLDPVRRSDGVTPLRAALPALRGRHDLCLLTVQSGPDPIWTLDRVRLGEPTPNP